MALPQSTGVPTPSKALMHTLHRTGTDGVAWCLQSVFLLMIARSRA